MTRPSCTWRRAPRTCTSPRRRSSRAPAPSLDEYRDHLASRLHLVPRFRQKLRFVPYGQGRPVWVDDPQLNLDYHVRHTALPEPGSEEQLRTLAARIFSQRLDRTKPVWEMWLVDGLEGGRFAVIGKSHHCLVDGVSGVDISTVLYDLEQEPTALPEPEPWIPAPEPSESQLLADALLERATSPAEMVRGARAARAPAQAGAAERRRRASWPPAPSRATSFDAPDSPFNAEIGPYRRFATVHTELAELKRIKNVAGGTVNDVVLDRRLRRPRQLPARARPLDRGPRAARDGPDQRAHGRSARPARQPGLLDDGQAARSGARTRSSACTW